MIDWQTEDDDEDWLDAPVESVAPARSIWRWLPLLIIFLVAILTAGFQLADRIERNLQFTREAVRQQHLLTLEAAVTHDEDLFRHLMRGSSLEWRVFQQLLLEENLLINKAPLNFWFDPNVNIDDLETAVQLSPDLTQATVQTIAPYLVLEDDGHFEPILFRQENEYLFRNDNWIQKQQAEGEDYWGETLVYQGQQFEIFYPARDKGIGRRLAEDLDTLAVLVCQDDRFVCAKKAEYRLLLDSTKTAVFRLGDNVRTKDIVQYMLIDVPIYTVKLPTPTLVGYPMNEASYQALYQGYASLFLAQFIYNLPTTEPITHQQVIEVLEEKGLRMPAVSAYDPLKTEAPPISFPDNSLMLACAEGRESVSWLYSPLSDQWTRIGQPFERFTSARHILKPSTFTFGDDVENQLLTAVPEAIRPLSLEIITYKNEGERVAVVAQVSKAHLDQFVFMYDGKDFEFIEIIRKRGHRPMPVTFEGNGRYLSLINYTYDRSVITLIDLQNESPTTRYTLKGTPFERYKWTDDGTWFVLIADRELHFVAPEYGYKKVVYHNQPGCLIGDWVQ